MQAVTVPTAVPSGPRLVTNQGPSTSAYQGYQILRRNGAVVAFEPNKIAVALMKAFLAVHGTQGAASASVRETVDSLTETVVRALLRSRPGGGTFHIEDVQDHVELGLMRGGHHEVARAYVLYRERRTQERAKQGRSAAVSEPALTVLDRGQRIPLDLRRLQTIIESACAGLGADVQAAPILAETKRNLYDGVPIDEVHKAAILAARTLIEKDPGYTRATARLLLHTIRREILGEEVLHVMRAGLERPVDSAQITGAQKTVTCPGRKRTDSGRAGYPGTYIDADPIPIRLSLVRLGDIALAGVNAEIFTTIAQRLKRESPLKHTMMVTLTNGVAPSGYIPNDAAYGYNTFEVVSSNLKPGCAETAITDGLIDLIGQAP